MANKGNSFCPDFCEKIHKAVTVSPFRRVFHPKPSNSHAKSSPPTPLKIQFKPGSPKHLKSAAVENREATDVVPINFDYSSQPPQIKKPSSPTDTPPESSQKNRPMAKIASKIQPEDASVGHKNAEAELAKGKIKNEGNKTEMHIEETFKECIDRTKNRFWTTSDAGGGNTAPPPAKDPPAKDGFSEYINRAKMRLRTTSSIGGGRNNSFK